jgi:membrane protein
VNPGALVATVLWLMGSVAFSIHVQNVGSYNETGSPGDVVILLMRWWLSAFIVLLGAS